MASRVNRRQFLTGAAAAGVAASGPFVITRPGWAQTGPIKIGVLEPTSGPVAYIGEANVAGFRFGAERVNAAGGVLGRKIEIVPADSELKPDVATRRAVRPFGPFNDCTSAGRPRRKQLGVGAVSYG